MKFSKKKIILVVVAVLFAVSGLSALPGGNYVGGIGCIVIAAVLLCFALKSKDKGNAAVNAPYPPHVENSDTTPFVASMSNTEKQELSKDNSMPLSVDVSQNPKCDSPKYDFVSFKVAGVTFSNDKPPKSRQTLLRKIYFRDEPFTNEADVELRKYEYEGEPAYGVYVNSYQIGNVPADMVSFVSENINRIDCISNISVYGGGRDDTGHAKSYGCEITLRLNKEG